MEIKLRRYDIYLHPTFYNYLKCKYYLVVKIPSIDGIFDYNQIYRRKIISWLKKEASFIGFDLKDYIDENNNLLVEMELSFSAGKISEIRNIPATCKFIDLRNNKIIEIKNIPEECEIVRLEGNIIKKISQHIPTKMRIMGLDFMIDPSCACIFEQGDEDHQYPWMCGNLIIERWDNGLYETELSDFTQKYDICEYFDVRDCEKIIISYLRIDFERIFDFQ